MADDRVDSRYELLERLKRAGISHYEARIKVTDDSIILIEDFKPSTELKIKK